MLPVDALDIDCLIGGPGSGVQNYWHIGPSGTYEDASLVDKPLARLQTSVKTGQGA